MMVNKDYEKVILSKIWITAGRLAHVASQIDDVTLCGNRNTMYVKVVSIKKFMPNRICKKCCSFIFTNDDYKKMPPSKRTTFKGGGLEYVLHSKMTQSIIREMISGMRYMEIQKITGGRSMCAYYINGLIAAKIIKLTDNLYSLTPLGLYARGLIKLIDQIDKYTTEDLEEFSVSLKQVMIIGSEPEWLEGVIRKVILETKK